MSRRARSQAQVATVLAIVSVASIAPGCSLIRDFGAFEKTPSSDGGVFRQADARIVLADGSLAPDGSIPDAGMVEGPCDGVDNDSDGTIDEGYNLRFDPAHCGYCDHACGSGRCADGFCTDQRDLVDVGESHACAVRRDGRLLCWGNNIYGQLGRDPGEAESVLEPALVPTIEGVHGVTVGLEFTCAWQIGGQVWCWGRNDVGQLGVEGIDEPNAEPIEVDAWREVEQVAAGWRHVCARLTSGDVQCMGTNLQGQLGGGGADPGGPTQISVPLADRTVELSGGANFTCAVLEDQNVWCWGRNHFSQLGTGMDHDQCSMGAQLTACSRVPVRAGTAAEQVAVSLGEDFALTVNDEGAVFGWGGNENTQLGLPPISPRTLPAAVVAVTNPVRSVHAGPTWSCAQMESGGLRCWGDNRTGDVGIGGAVTNVNEGAVVSLPEPIVAMPRNSFGSNCALLTGDQLHCWGRNGFGTVGDGTRSDTYYPVRVPAYPDGR